MFELTVPDLYLQVSLNTTLIYLSGVKQRDSSDVALFMKTLGAKYLHRDFNPSCVMCFHVASKMVYFIESFSTDMAVMCKVSRVQLHVAVQLTFCCVSFVTQSAGKVVAIV